MWGTCYGASNNIHFDFPPIMQDGRNYSSWQPEAVVNDNIRKQENIKSNWEYRKFLTNNALQIMKYNNQEACNDLGLPSHIENNNNPLSLCENLSTDVKKKQYILGGTFTEFDIKNRNERIYTAPKFLPCLTEFNERISTMAVYGECDHPDVFDTSIKLASHLVTQAVFNKDKNLVEGKIKLAPTPWGKTVKEMVDDEFPIYVSSRAAGITENDGSVTIKKLFTYDIVADPGFASAKMRSMNETCGYKDPNVNFRIYEMSDESKINEIFNMNKNDVVTKKQLDDYSVFLIKEMASIKKVCNEAVKKGKMEPKKLENLLEYYDNLNATNAKMVQYLDYLADTVQVVVNENKNLKKVSKQLIEHNDYLAKRVSKSINYMQYIAEELDKNIIYSEYIAEQLDKNIIYSEYIAENLDRNIIYSEYIAECTDNVTAFAQYLKENLSNSIDYTQHVAGHVRSSIEYIQYIAENLDENLGYSEYIAEQLDKSITLSGVIVDKLNSKKLNEDANGGHQFPSLHEFGFVAELETEEPENDEVSNEVPVPTADPVNPMDIQPTTEQPVMIDPAIEHPSVDININITTDNPDEQAEVEDVVVNETPAESNETEENEETEEATEPYVGESSLSKQIDKLIDEARKRKVVESSDLHFLGFLNKSQVNAYHALTNEEKEAVKLNIEGKPYFSDKDVLLLMSEALSVKNETMENRVIRLMPDVIKPLWANLSESAKLSVLSQARLHPNLTNESAIEYFWNTRNLNTQPSTKVVISHDDSLIQNDKLSDSEFNFIMERINSLK